MENKKIVIILMIYTIIFTLVGGTFAYLNWESDNYRKTNITFTINPDFTCGADGGGNITSNDVNLIPADCTDSEYAIKRVVTTNVTTTGDKVVSLDLWLDINNISTNLSNSNYGGQYYQEGTYKTKITDIYFVYDEDLPSGIQTNNVKTYDLSNTTGKPITGYLIENTDVGADPDTYKLYVSSEYKMYAQRLEYAFDHMTNLKTVTFTNFDTSEATRFDGLFLGCSYC